MGRETHKVCATTFQIPNMLFSLALPQRFNTAILGAVQYLQFPLTLADPRFTLTLSFSDYILFSVLFFFLQKVCWDFPYLK